jgi:hypothetical protein
MEGKSSRPWFQLDCFQGLIAAQKMLSNLLDDSISVSRKVRTLIKTSNTADYHESENGKPERFIGTSVEH